jgi:hypothetical protein
MLIHVLLYVASLAIAFFVIFTAVVVIGAIITAIVDSRCPGCRRFFKRKLRATQLLAPPDLQFEGRRKIYYSCSRCSYGWEKKEAIPKLDNRHPSRCPKCYEFHTQKISVTIICFQTPESEAKEKVTCLCPSCSHRWEYERVPNYITHGAHPGGDCFDP